MNMFCKVRIISLKQIRCSRSGIDSLQIDFIGVSMKKSRKQQQLEKNILKLLEGTALDVAAYIFEDKEIQVLQDYANIVSIKRLGYNDHGPVHMRKCALNSLIMFDLLNEAEVKFNFVKEGFGTINDSRIIVLIASLLHDIGMTITRSNHEFLSVQLAEPIIERILTKFYSDDYSKTIVLRSMITEGIFGHMATQPITSVEAGLVLVGDGCDMEKGRARIPSLLQGRPRVGDIHRYSASAIQRVLIEKGEDKPIKIVVEMSQSAGIFQVEEVLLTKINFSPILKYIELYAGVKDVETLKYL